MVITYVDGSDPIHTARREALRQAMGSKAPQSPERPSWYRGVGEITYGIRSVLACMPWIGTIHVVTDRQVPLVDRALLDAGRVRIVDHAAFIPERYRPTFASTVIESFLHRIPDLADIYLYNNDDFMHGSAIMQDEFCKADAGGNLSLRLRTVPALVRTLIRAASGRSPEFLPQANPYTSGIANSARLLRQRCGLPWRNIVFPRHLTQVYRIATARQVEALFAEELHVARQRHFRGTDQLSWSTLTYSAECQWHAAQQRPYRPWPWRQAADELFVDFSRLASPVRQAAAWRKVGQSSARFMCLNNIPVDQRHAYEQAMAARGLARPVPD